MTLAPFRWASHGQDVQADPRPYAFWQIATRKGNLLRPILRTEALLVKLGHYPSLDFRTHALAPDLTSGHAFLGNERQRCQHQLPRIGPRKPVNGFNVGAPRSLW